MKTAGEAIRGLLRHYDGTYALNCAVNDWRRAHGSKNWLAAALELLKIKEEDALHSCNKQL